MNASLVSVCSQPNRSHFGPEHRLKPLWVGEAPGVAQWEGELRPQLRQRWLELLGDPATRRSAWEGSAQEVGRLSGPDYSVTLYLQPSGPDGQRQRVAILRPNQPAGDPAPCAIIPFYHPEAMAGLLPGAFEGEPRFAEESEPTPEAIVFGRHLARLGLVVACVEAFPFNTVPDPGGERFDWWRLAAARLLEQNPDWTGIAKLAADTSLALDLLLAQPGVDPKRVLAMGHSLGGKMAFYTGALDERITCVIGSDFGLPWRSTNWDARWYHGPERVAKAEASSMAHHELLALLAPRPFLLVAGEADDATSWQYLEAARPAYALYGAGERLGNIDHASGHRPPLCAVDFAYAWLGEIFGLPHRRWRVS